MKNINFLLLISFFSTATIKAHVDSPSPKIGHTNLWMVGAGTVEYSIRM
jgi:hypothetical protein